MMSICHKYFPHGLEFKMSHIALLCRYVVGWFQKTDNPDSSWVRFWSVTLDIKALLKLVALYHGYHH